MRIFVRFSFKLLCDLSTFRCCSDLSCVRGTLRQLKCGPCKAESRYPKSKVFVPVTSPCGPLSATSQVCFTPQRKALILHQSPTSMLRLPSTKRSRAREQGLVIAARRSTVLYKRGTCAPVILIPALSWLPNLVTTLNKGKRKPVRDGLCVCRAGANCLDGCLNRETFVECDDDNCDVGGNCANRVIQNLVAHTEKAGNLIDGLEVFTTFDRGQGVRATRDFAPKQVATYFTGKVMTLRAFERSHGDLEKRYPYLLKIDAQMILDASTGSMARFINHSCRANCRVEKWMVRGHAYLALFVGESKLDTGQELTIDYHITSSFQESLQECVCQVSGCKGIIGRNRKAQTTANEEAMSKKVKA